MVDDILVRALLDERLLPIEEPEADFPETPPGGVSLTVRGLTKAFGSHAVLQGVDLHVRSGEFLSVIGKSGSGKSTLLRILAGLDEPNSGDVLFDSLPRAHSSHVARLMFQEPRLLPWARVIDNVEVGLGDRRYEAGAERHALAKLAAVGLESRARDWPSVLSGGQKQRVALARALASRPNVLALDEPLGALDALTRMDMQTLVEQVWQEQGFTAVLVTHDVTEAIVLGDRVVLIEDGVVTLELDVDLPRPRRRGSPEIAALEEQVLRRLFSDAGYVAQGSSS
ncbi:sulfonate transport system ATP-binding protein [Enhydrobacter aerosaccus]|uniref:Sulfonate transport system ATP-binding protein n=1 Tax=Enhydrobacter aerosaccus TaxID=225324 RepID=A0A1T4NV47_9HYPH|nr:ATP-binding cassette domain-containing protein [Enhydrobacter aerosaccus]SJZ83045.1 sulfonate transport system ATP-binding protein [Enhydrobacter aerosaccus]